VIHIYTIHIDKPMCLYISDSTGFLIVRLYGLLIIRLHSNSQAPLASALKSEAHDTHVQEVVCSVCVALATVIAHFVGAADTIKQITSPYY
jgi:hypothetical protein